MSTDIVARLRYLDQCVRELRQEEPQPGELADAADAITGLLEALKEARERVIADGPLSGDDPLVARIDSAIAAATEGK